MKSIWCHLGIHDWERIDSSAVHKHDPMNATRETRNHWYYGEEGPYSNCWVFDYICLRLGCGVYRLKAKAFKAKWARKQVNEIRAEQLKKERSRQAEDKAVLRNIYKNSSTI